MTDQNDINQVKLIVAGDVVEDDETASVDEEGFQEQAHIPFLRSGEKKVDMETMVADYTKIRSQLTKIFLAPEAASDGSGFRLDELTVHLGVSAKGGIGFIAEVGVEASVELKFVRH